jgi:F0F1-type ATP synthase membrane subunit b/b'
MGELAGIAEAFSKYGAWMFVAVLLLVVRALYNRVNAIQDARLQDVRDTLRESIKAQDATAHSLEMLEQLIKGLPR